MVYLAAKLLKCDPDTVMNYCRRYPSVEAAKMAARGEMLDTAELKLFQAVQNGEAWAIAFCLKTVGRSRGYIEKQELSGTVHLTTSPEWQVMRAAILRSVSDQPVARERLTAVLSGQLPSGEDHTNGATNGVGH
jgi:hypothetical protein